MKKALLLFLFCILLFSVHPAVLGFQKTDEFPLFEDGMAMPMLNYSDPSAANEES